MDKKIYSDDDLLPLSGIQHMAFCERQWALIHVERLWRENQRTVEGRHLHERAHDPTIITATEDGLAVRAQPIVSYTLGLYGVADVVEFHRDPTGIALPGNDGLWLPRPVEYKRGRPKKDDRDEVQLCAQAICLEEMMQVIIEAADLYYGQPRRRVHILLDQSLRERVRELSEKMHRLFAEGVTPEAEPGKPCSLCSLAEVCMPKLTLKRRSVENYIRANLAAEVDDSAGTVSEP